MSRRGRDFPGRTPGPGGSVRTVDAARDRRIDGEALGRDFLATVRAVAAVAVLGALKRRLDALQPSLAANLIVLAEGEFRALTDARGGRERLREVWDELTDVKERVPRSP